MSSIFYFVCRLFLLRGLVLIFEKGIRWQFLSPANPAHWPSLPPRSSAEPDTFYSRNPPPSSTCSRCRPDGWCAAFPAPPASLYPSTEWKKATEKFSIWCSRDGSTAPSRSHCGSRSAKRPTATSTRRWTWPTSSTAPTTTKRIGMEIARISPRDATWTARWWAWRRRWRSCWSTPSRCCCRGWSMGLVGPTRRIRRRCGRWPGATRWNCPIMWCRCWWRRGRRWRTSFCVRLRRVSLGNPLDSGCVTALVREMKEFYPDPDAERCPLILVLDNVSSTWLIDSVLDSIWLIRSLDALIDWLVDWLID